MDEDDITQLRDLVDSLVERGDSLEGFAMRGTYFEAETHPESHPLLQSMEMLASANDMKLERRILAYQDKNLLQYDVTWRGSHTGLIEVACAASEAWTVINSSLNLAPQLDFTFIGSPAPSLEEE
tara:strand:- start:133 stop:507 length:375 start_codon:yes stop_codon:yes gene_type:complete